MTKNNIKSSSLNDVFFPSDSGDLISNDYLSITHGIQITVRPEFVDSQFSAIGNLFVWIYHVRIDNRSMETIKLVNRYWKIIDEKGTVQEVNGEGVVGSQPLILPNNSFQYESGVHLRHPSGIMTGHYQMQKNNGELFNTKIPAFSLDVPNAKSVIN
ncbi:MAG: Co2+/Mg2+ efflux protein ApaG [Proteobacteria bacterium]|nr:Co2+/Mg2+ efflux protein ApaG [Pseudomonadota bacterium]